MKQKILRILPIVTTIAIMVLIFGFSSQNSTQSSELSAGITRRIIDIFPLTAHADEAQKIIYIDMIHNTVRKCAHFIIYASLGFSAEAMFIANNPKRKKRYMWLCGIALCCVYAATDEFHQSMVAGRGPGVGDVVIDTCGGAAGAAAFIAVMMVYNKLKAKGRKTT
jgi:VanZ family protein